MIEKLEKQLGKVSDGINNVSKVLLGIIVGAMFLIIITQVILRYFFSGGFSWAEEVTVFLMAWMTFLGSAIAIKQSEHINIDMLIEKLGGNARIFLVMIGKIIILSFVIIFVIYGWEFAYRSFNYHSNVLRIPLFWPRLSISLAGAMMIIHLVHSLLKDFLEVKKH